MKSIKILLSIAILSTSFYACKKEEMIKDSNEVKFVSQSQNNLEAENVTSAASNLSNLGLVKVVFSRVGSMIIEGNPNIEKLLNMYNGSEKALKSAQDVFNQTQETNLYITFDRNGNAIASNIPSCPAGSTFDAFISNFCQVKPSDAMKLSITKYELNRNHLEFWDAMPVGTIENFESNVKSIQEKMPVGYTMQLEINTNSELNFIVLDSNGNPQETVSEPCGGSSGTTWFSGFAKLDCFRDFFSWI